MPSPLPSTAPSAAAPLPDLAGHMFRSLLRNIAITGMAYAAISLVGLLLAPVFIASFGLSGYGQILLARVFLPSAAFGLLDLGVGENTTRIVASARAHNQWGQAGRGIGLILMIALAMSAIAGTALALLAPQIAAWMSIADTEQAGFVVVLLATASVLPVLFLSLVAEGVLKGFEAFKKLRSCEVVSAVSYASMSLVAIGLGKGPNVMSLALLAGLIIRTAMATWWAWGLLRKQGFRLHRADAATQQDILAWSGTMLFSKLIGTVQTQVQNPLLGILVGPTAVGMFDAIVRLPRFVKSIFSLISATVMPMAARLRAQEDHEATRRLARTGMLGAFIVCTPPAVMAGIYSYSILDAWMGQRVATFWVWQAAMFVVPVVNVVTSFGSSILLSDRVAAISLNRLSFVQVVLQIGLSLALLPWLQPWSFALGQIVSVLLLIPFQLRLIRRHLGLEGGMGWRMILATAASAAISTTMYLIIPRPDLLALLALLATGSVLGWLAAPFVAMDRTSRQQFFALLGQRLRPKFGELDRKIGP